MNQKKQMLTPLRNQQTGLVSILLVIMIMFILTLIVMAFVKLTNREQRQTLDRQLNTQAFYAAESGVNDAVRAIQANPALGTRDYDECNDFIDQTGLNPEISPGGPISYSCLLVDPTPTSLVYDNVSPAESAVIPIRSTTPINQLQVGWQDSNNGGKRLINCPAKGDYPAQLAGDCQVGMLRVEFIKGSDINRGRTEVINNTGVIFAQPTNRDGGEDAGVAFSDTVGSNMGAQVFAHCLPPEDVLSNVPTHCSFNITGLGGITEGYLRVRGIYRTSRVDVRALGSGPGFIELQGAQADIDVTGRANDVLRRIRVRVPFGGDGPLMPEYALQSRRTQCKRFFVQADPPYTESVSDVPDWCSPRDPVPDP